MIIFATVYIDFCTYNMFIITLIDITYKSILIYRRLSCRKVHHENQFVQKHGSMMCHLLKSKLQRIGVASILKGGNVIRHPCTEKYPSKVKMFSACSLHVSCFFDTITRDSKCSIDLLSCITEHNKRLQSWESTKSKKIIPQLRFIYTFII